MFARPALIVYSFAPKELPSYPKRCEAAHLYLEKLWNACGLLGMSQPVPELDYATEFPSGVDLENTSFRIVAAKVDLERRKKRSDYQAFLFEYQDMFGLVATFESSSETVNLTQWQGLLKEWNRSVGDILPPDGLMKECYLFTALNEPGTLTSPDTWLSDEHFSSTIASKLGEAVIGALPGSAGVLELARSFYITDSGYYIWEGKPLKSRHVFAIVTSEAKQDDLFGWMVWPDPYTLAPFARYLIHRAKLHFAEQIFKRDVISLHHQARTLDWVVERLMLLCKQSEEDDSWNLNEIIKAHDSIVAAQTRSFDLLKGISRLKELLLTTKIAGRNMHRLVPAKSPGLRRAEEAIFERDRTRALWLREQMEMDLGYLAALRERAREGHQMAALLLERESQRTERRRKNLVLLQVTVLGSITIGLLMLPAFEVFHEHQGVVWSVSAWLVAVALALPRLFERWHEDYGRVDDVMGGLLGAATFSLGVTVWIHLHLPVFHVSFGMDVIFRLLVCICGFVLGYFAVVQMEKLKIKMRNRRLKERISNLTKEPGRAVPPTG